MTDEIPDRVENFFPEPEPPVKPSDIYDVEKDVGVRSQRPPTAMQGPARRPPPYYIGMSINVSGHTVRCIPSDVRPGDYIVRAKRDKLARRLIRAVFRRSHSRVEQHILKARDIRLEVERLADNSHEKQRYMERTLSVHEPKPTRLSRSEARAETHKTRMRNRRDKLAGQIMRQKRELDGVRGIVAAFGALR